MKHESNLTFAIAKQLFDRSIPFELEWSSPVGRPDISIKTDELLYGIIEVKHFFKEGTFQLKRYASLGVPVMVAHWESHIDLVVDTADSWFQDIAVPILGLGEKSGLVKRYRKKRKKLTMEWDEDLNIRW